MIFMRQMHRILKYKDLKQALLEKLKGRNRQEAAEGDFLTTLSNRLKQTKTPKKDVKD